MRQVGPSRRSIATSQLTIVSTASQGRHTALFGIRRSEETCSIGWWVGPSSPKPMLS